MLAMLWPYRLALVRIPRLRDGAGDSRLSWISRSHPCGRAYLGRPRVLSLGPAPREPRTSPPYRAAALVWSLAVKTGDCRLRAVALADYRAARRAAAPALPVPGFSRLLEIKQELTTLRA